MAKKLKDFMIGLAKKAGMNTEDQSVLAFFNTEALTTVDVPDDVEKGIDNSLISLTDALNNHPKIKNHYTALAMNGVDSTVESLLQEYGVDTDEIKAEKSSFKKVQLLAKAIKDLEVKKSGGNTTHQKQIDELQEQLRALKESERTLVKKHSDEMLNYKIQSRLDGLVSGVKTIYDDLSADVKATTLSTILSKELQDNGVKFAFDENGKFTLLKSDGTNYYGENHQQITPQQFIESTLSRNKLIKVNGQPPTPTGQQAPPGANGKTSYSPVMKELIDKSLNDIKNAETVSIM